MAVFTSEQKQLSRQLIRATTGFTVSLSLRSIKLHTRARLFLYNFPFFCSLVRRISSCASSLPSPTSGFTATWTSTTSMSAAPSKGEQKKSQKTYQIILCQTLGQCYLETCFWSPARMLFRCHLFLAIVVIIWHCACSVQLPRLMSTSCQWFVQDMLR